MRASSRKSWRSPGSREGGRVRFTTTQRCRRRAREGPNASSGTARPRMPYRPRPGGDTRGRRRRPRRQTIRSAAHPRHPSTAERAASSRRHRHPRAATRTSRPGRRRTRPRRARRPLGTDIGKLRGGRPARRGAHRKERLNVNQDEFPPEVASSEPRGPSRQRDGALRSGSGATIAPEARTQPHRVAWSKPLGVFDEGHDGRSVAGPQERESQDTQRQADDRDSERRRTAVRLVGR